MEIKKIKVMYGGKDYEVIVNMRKSFQLTKYRLKIQDGNSAEDLDGDTIKQIQDFANSKEKDIYKLSPKARKYLMNASTKVFKDIEYEDLIDILKIVFDIDDEEAEKILNDNYDLNGFDETLTETINLIEAVFMSAKDTSEQKAKSKKELNRVAK